MVYITFAIMLILMIYTLVKRKWLVSTYLIGVYTFSLFFSIMLSNTTYRYANYYSFFGSIVFTILTLIYFYPFIKRKPSISHDSSEEFKAKFIKVGYLFSILLIIGMILLAPYVFDSFAFGLADIREDMYMGNSVERSYTLLGHIGHSILRWLGWMGYINLVMFFYSLIYIPRKYILKILLVLSSFGPIWISLLNGGRTYVIYWILFFFFCIAVFYKEFTFKRKRQVFGVMVVAIAVLGSYFAFMTNSRIAIGAANSSNSTSFLITYVGMPYWNFNYFFDNCQWHPYSLQRILPLLSSLVVGRFDLSEYRAMIQSHTSLNIGTFYTFMGDIYIDVGIIGLLIYTVFFVFLATRLMKVTTFRFHHLIFLSILIQIPLMGLFYYSYYQMETTFAIIVALLVARYLNVDAKKIRIRLGRTSVDV